MTKQYWLDVSVNDVKAAIRIPLSSAPHAMHAQASDSASSAAHAIKADTSSVALLANGLATGLAVTSLNGLTGAATLAAGSGLTLTPTGSTLSLSSALPLQSTNSDSIGFSATKVQFAPNTEFNTQPHFHMNASGSGQYPNASSIKMDGGDTISLYSGYGTPGGSGGSNLRVTTYQIALGTASSGSGKFSGDSLLVRGNSGTGVRSFASSPSSGYDASALISNGAVTLKSAAVGLTAATANASSITMSGKAITVKSANATDTNTITISPTSVSLSRVLQLKAVDKASLPTCNSTNAGSLAVIYNYNTTYNDYEAFCQYYGNPGGSGARWVVFDTFSLMK